MEKEILSRASKFGGLMEVEFEVVTFLSPAYSRFTIVKNRVETECGIISNEHDNELLVQDITPSICILDKLNSDDKAPFNRYLNIDYSMEFRADISRLHIEKWARNYDIADAGCFVTDGTTWKLTLKFDKGRTIIREGYMLYPDNWNEFINVLSKYTSNFDFLLEEDAVEE